jgi:hypothetical protein
MVCEHLCKSIINDVVVKALLMMHLLNIYVRALIMVCLHKIGALIKGKK